MIFLYFAVRMFLMLMDSFENECETLCWLMFSASEHNVQDRQCTLAPENICATSCIFIILLKDTKNIFVGWTVITSTSLSSEQIPNARSKPTQQATQAVLVPAH